jgi:subtilisin family serine protease
MGRLVAVAVVVCAALACAAPALAGVPAKRGRPFLPPPLPGPRALQALGGAGDLLVQATRPGTPADFHLAAAGGVELSRTLRLWRVRAAAIAPVLPPLAAAGLIRSVSRDRTIRPLRASRRLAFADPLVPLEWWRAAVAADALPPPGPGKPVTVIDSGLDVTHPEFAGRPDTVLLNEQTTTGVEEEHGTAVASVVGAPADGEGIVGVYPRALLRSWDASANAADGILLSAEIAGLDRAARTPGVVNLSLGGTDYSFDEEQAIEAAFGAGSLVVASAGNEFEEGNPNEYPASFNHVLTIAATGRGGAPTGFSNAKLSVDLAAPGAGIPVAIPLDAPPSDPASGLPAGFDLWDGTSFSAPIVAGAAAWVWTVRRALDNTQLFDLLRYSARDIYRRGYDTSTGFGMLDIKAALRNTPPAPDPQEPNEDVDLVRPGGLFSRGSQLLTYPGKAVAGLNARLDVTEDPEDVYRFWLPARSRVELRMTPDDDTDLEVWDSATRTVHERGARARRDLLGVSTLPGTREDAVVVENDTAKGRIAYADVYLGEKANDAYYRLTIRPA